MYLKKNTINNITLIRENFFFLIGFDSSPKWLSYLILTIKFKYVWYVKKMLVV